MARTATLLAILAALGCKKTEAPVPTTQPPPGDMALDRARAAARSLGATLRKRLVEAHSKGGPAAAVRVCADEAQALSRSVSEKTRVAVGRSSLRLRNMANAPAPWVAQWLKAQGDRAAAGVEGLSRVEETAHGPRARVILPITVEPLCVSCHGPAQTLPKDVQAALKERYPLDRAVGYRVGDLRGALWAEAQVER
jgi:hypothetical protein